jgi:hypothetical protein
MRKPTICYIEQFERMLECIKGCYITDASYENMIEEINRMKREVSNG